MLKDVVEVQPTKDYRLRLRLEDGAEGEVDVAVLTEFEGIFAPLKARNECLKQGLCRSGIRDRLLAQ